MQDSPLLISGIIRHGESVYSEKKVFTVTHEGVERQRSFRSPSAPSSWPPRSPSSGCNRRPGWNVHVDNQAHMEAYIAVPCMGAVLHTLNIGSSRNSWRLSSTTPGTR